MAGKWARVKRKDIPAQKDNSMWKVLVRVRDFKEMCSWNHRE